MGGRHDLHPTWTGFLYLAVVIDAFSRKVVGWAMGERMTADLVLAALNMALHTGRPDSVVHHSDQGSQRANRLWQPLPGDGRAAVDGYGGRRLRQRHA